MVLTATSDASRSSIAGDEEDAVDAHGRMDAACLPAGAEKVAQ